MSITGTNNPFACDPVIFTATNSIIALGTITRVGNAFTFSVGFVWKINGTIYQNAAPITITVAEADAGYNRIDNAILNTSNSIELQQGLPSNAVALQPVEPENAILLTSWDISGASVSEEVPPIVGSNFLQKEFEKSQVVNMSGTGVVIPLNIKGRNNIILNGAMTGVVGFSLVNLAANPANAEYPHEGKDYYIQNKTGHDVTLKNFDTTVDIPFVLKNGADLVVPNNGIVFFKNNSYTLVEYFKNFDYISSIQNTTTYTSLPTTVEQVLSTTLIPANTFSDLDVIQLKALLIKPTENGNLALTAYINNANTLVGANQFYRVSSIQNTLNAIIIDSFISVIKNGKIKGAFALGSGTSFHPIVSSISYNVTEFNFDPTIDNYLITTVQLGNSVDVVTQEALILSKIN